MKTTHSLIALSLLALLGAGAVEARERPQGGAHQPHQRGNFTSDSSRTNGDGKTISRHTEQTASDNGFERKTTLTNAQGQTATRNVTGTLDKDSKTMTKTVEGTTFDGKTYSRETVKQKTDSGWTSESQATGPNGQSGSRSAIATVDKAAGTVTKDISVTHPNGEVTNKTVTKSRQVEQQ